MVPQITKNITVKPWLDPQNTHTSRASSVSILSACLYSLLFLEGSSAPCCLMQARLPQRSASLPLPLPRPLSAREPLAQKGGTAPTQGADAYFLLTYAPG